MIVLNLLDKQNDDFNVVKFPDGQHDFSLNHTLKYQKAGKVVIQARINDFIDLEILIIATKCLRGLGIDMIDLHLPYVLGSRSDRKFKEGGTNYIKNVISPIINSLKFHEVVVMDPHSDVVEACIDNVRIINNINFVQTALQIFRKNKVITVPSDVVLVSPDAGALKKIFKLKDNITGLDHLVIAAKNRDVNGKITHTSISNLLDGYEGKTFVIVDDICDGGRTFIEIAKVLRARYKKIKIVLVITHGIFSKGLGVIYDHIDYVATTNSYKEVEDESYILSGDLYSYDIFKNITFKNITFKA